MALSTRSNDCTAAESPRLVSLSSICHRFPFHTLYLYTFFRVFFLFSGSLFVQACKPSAPSQGTGSFGFTRQRTAALGEIRLSSPISRAARRIFQSASRSEMIQEYCQRFFLRLPVGVSDRSLRKIMLALSAHAVVDASFRREVASQLAPQLRSRS